MAKKKNQSGRKNQKPLSDENYIRQAARKLPIGKCYISEGWEQEGLAVVIVTRSRPNGNFVVGSYLIDTYCLGVKDASYWANMDTEDFDELKKRYERSLTFREATYAEAHNLVLGAVEFAEEAGIPPHKDFAVAEYILEEDTDDIPLIEYEYGIDGKRMLVVGPFGSERKYIPMLKKKYGDDFEFVDEYSGYDYNFEDDDDFIGEYDDDEYDDDEYDDDDDEYPDNNDDNSDKNTPSM